MGIALSLIFAAVVIVIFFIVWAVNGAESRSNARNAEKELRANRTIKPESPADRGTGVN